MLEAGGIAAPLRTDLARYGAQLLERNRRFNLTGAENASQLAPHLLDSLTVTPYVREPLVDVGSGGGLPAIPVALATGIPVTLVESTGKKAGFLREMLDAFSLRGEVIPERAESAARREDLRGAFLSGTARAVSSAPTVLELVVPMLAVGGTAVLQRGRMDGRERRAVQDAAPMLGAELAQEIELDGEHRILVVRKVVETPQRFPRRTGIPEKRPLCL